MLARVGVAGDRRAFRRHPRATSGSIADLDLPPGKTEMEVERMLAALAAKNVAAGSCHFSSAPAPISITSPQASII